MSKVDEQATLRVVLVGQVPPPLHGQAAVNALLQRARFEGVDLYTVPMRFSRHLAEVDRFAWRKFVELLRVLTLVFWQVARRRRDLLAYSVGLRTARPIARDVVVLLLCRPFFKQTVLHLHTQEPLELIDRLALPLRVLAYKAYGGADAVFVVAEVFAGSNKLFPAAKQIIVVENGIEPPPSIPRSATSRGTKTVLFVGNLYETKGTHVLMRACAALRDRGLADFRVDVMGVPPSSDAAEELHRLAEDLKLNGIVRFLGARHGQQKWAAFADADVFCYPTLADAAPLVVLEALAAGLPVVTTRTGGIPSLVEDGVTGAVVEPDDADAVARALFELLTCTERREAMASAAREQYLERFTAEAFCARFEEAIVRVAGATPRCGLPVAAMVDGRRLGG